MHCKEYLVTIFIFPKIKLLSVDVLFIISVILQHSLYSNTIYIHNNNAGNYLQIKENRGRTKQWLVPNERICVVARLNCLRDSYPT